MANLTLDHPTNNVMHSITADIIIEDCVIRTSIILEVMAAVTMSKTAFWGVVCRLIEIC
jgi:hypothetical protein